MPLFEAIELDPIVKSLTATRRSEHFLLRYAMRNPKTGVGSGAHGVRRAALISQYVKALETAWRALTEEPWKRPTPVSDGCTPVYIYDTQDPMTIPFQWRLPAVILRSRNEEPVVKPELQRASADAVHEVMHVFNFREHPMTEESSRRWAWFDEGMAVFFEEWLLPNNPDHRRFLMDWIDCPEGSLDDWDRMYQTGMFVRYLANRFGCEFVNQVWTTSRRDETPFAAINRLLPGGLKFSSAGSREPDVFSAYCGDAYFPRDPASHCHAPRVWERFGDRAVTESFSLRPGDRVEAASELDHLACRYFRLSLQAGVKNLPVRLQTRPAAKHSPLKAELAMVMRAGLRGATQPLQPLVAAQPGEPLRLSVEVAISNPNELDHLVLVVANCGTRPEPPNLRLPHDDGQQFKIEVSAE